MHLHLMDSTLRFSCHRTINNNKPRLRIISTSNISTSNIFILHHNVHPFCPGVAANHSSIIIIHLLTLTRSRSWLLNEAPTGARLRLCINSPYVVYVVWFSVDAMFWCCRMRNRPQLTLPFIVHHTIYRNIYTNFCPLMGSEAVVCLDDREGQADLNCCLRFFWCLLRYGYIRKLERIMRIGGGQRVESWRWWDISNPMLQLSKSSHYVMYAHNKYLPSAGTRIYYFHWLPKSAHGSLQYSIIIWWMSSKNITLY